MLLTKWQHGSVIRNNLSKKSTKVFNANRLLTSNHKLKLNGNVTEVWKMLVSNQAYGWNSFFCKLPAFSFNRRQPKWLFQNKDQKRACNFYSNALYNTYYYAYFLQSSAVLVFLLNFGVCLSFSKLVVFPKFLWHPSLFWDLILISYTNCQKISQFVITVLDSKQWEKSCNLLSSEVR